MCSMQSSVIKNYWYYRGRLTIRFKNGAAYDYYGVPATQWDEFKRAKSKGVYFNDNIKGQYTCFKRPV